MRNILAGFMVLHGFAHLVGFLGSWGLSKSIPYHTTVFNGRVDIGETGIRVIGVLWLLTALAFAATGITAFMNQRSWMMVAAIVAAVSLVLCAVELPAARIGLVINAFILVALATAARMDWLT